MKLTKEERKELEMWHKNIKSIKDNVESQCLFILNRIDYMLGECPDKDKETE